MAIVRDDRPVSADQTYPILPAPQLCKLNVQDQTVVTWKESSDLFPGECVFIPRPGAVDEDDGVVLSIVLSANESRSHFLLILDGRTFQEIARADIVKGKGTIPPTIHGVYEYINNRQ